MSIADKLQTLAENEQRISNEVGDQADLIAQITSVIDEKLAGGGGEEPVNKLAGVVDGTVTELTAEDLAGLKTTRKHAFYNLSTLTSITIPDSVTSLGEATFYNCSGLKSIIIPDSVTSIADTVFNNCSNLTSVIIGSGVTTIGSSAFYGCGFTEIIIPNNVVTLGSSTFNYCKNLKRADFSNHTTVPKLRGGYAFSGTHADLQIKVPASLIDSWKNATNWSTYAKNIVTEFTNEV